MSSKFGSLIYSSSVLASDTGACRDDEQTFIILNKTGAHMSEIGYLYIEHVLQLLCDTEVIHNALGLLAKVLVDLQSILCIDLRHLEIML